MRFQIQINCIVLLTDGKANEGTNRTGGNVHVTRLC
jgi:Mg-chelatase subunit ChlD